MTSPPVRRLVPRLNLPLFFLAAAGLGVGCSASGSSAPTPGSGGSGSGGSGNGSGGRTNVGSGGSGNPGSGGSGQGSTGTGGNGNAASGGNGTPATGGNGQSASGGNGTSASGGNGQSPGTGGNGNSATGGAGNPPGGTGGVASGGGTSGTNPPGYWTYAPKGWFGCSWTGIDALAGSTTTNTPKDFLTKAPGDPYCVSGTVYANNDAVALLGFNLAEPAAGADCSYKPADPTKDGPPAVTLTGTGIAVSFSKKISTDMRIQVQGPNGGKAGTVGAADRWCAKITDPTGPVFVPYTSFNSKCWDGSGTTFNPASNKVSAVSFLVAGGAAATPFNYCIGGFSTGSSVADAPAYTGMSGPVSGTIGGPDPTGGTAIDFQRVKVAAGGHSYVIQNNNWGTPTSTDQTITYTDNSFKITSPTGGSPDGMKPASFPSIFIGASGDTQMGTFSTHLNNGMANQAGDGLPKQISAIKSVLSTFKYNTAGGDYNATYDIWFSAAPPSSAYDDGISGFVMIWLYKPGSRSPIGSVVRSNVTVPGAPGTWNVWVGPRGTGANPNRPVVSYVATSTLMALTNVDIKAFITDAATNGISASWYLTDVFAGFEIWNGSGTSGLSVTEFTAVVQ